MLPDPGETQVAQLGQMERVDGDLRVREIAGDRLLERRRGIDGDDLDPVAPGLVLVGQPTFDGGAVRPSTTPRT